MCDFKIREVGNPNKSHRYTVQCVLPINLFNQQAFTFIWLWYIIVLVWNIVQLGVWFQKSLPLKSKKWISKRIFLMSKTLKNRKERLEHFLEHYLEPDGIFMIRMIANNTSDYVATDVIHNLWCQHAEKYDRLFPDEPHTTDEDTVCTFEHIKKANQPEPPAPIRPAPIEHSHDNVHHHHLHINDDKNVDYANLTHYSDKNSQVNKFPTGGLKTSFGLLKSDKKVEDINSSRPSSGLDVNTELQAARSRLLSEDFSDQEIINTRMRPRGSIFRPPNNPNFSDV